MEMNSTQHNLEKTKDDMHPHPLCVHLFLLVLTSSGTSRSARKGMIPMKRNGQEDVGRESPQAPPTAAPSSPAAPRRAPPRSASSPPSPHVELRLGLHLPCLLPCASPARAKEKIMRCGGGGDGEWSWRGLGREERGDWGRLERSGGA
jgi:hypothetical protein